MAHCATINFVINNKLLNFEFNNQVIVTSSHLEKKKLWIVQHALIIFPYWHDL